MSLAEGLLAAVLLTALTLANNLPILRGLTTTAAGDLGDPLYFAWQLSWLGHAVRDGAANLYTTNAFQQAPDNLAYTDVVYGYLPLAWFVPSGQAGALAQLNLALLVATAMATFGGYALARVLGAGVTGAAVAAMAMGFAPWRDIQVIHINIVSTGGIILAAAMLAYGHGWSLREGWQPELLESGRRARWVLAGWAMSCWQLSIGLATGIWFSYFLMLIMICLLVAWVRRWRRTRVAPLQIVPRRVLFADLAGGLVFVGSALALVQPYLRVLADAPEAQRSAAMLDLFSPPWYGLIAAGPLNDFWGGRQLDWQAQISLGWPPEMYASVGVAVLVLAVLGLFVSVWPRRRRFTLAAITAVLAVLAMGTRGPDGGRWTYLPLYDWLPGWEYIRTPGRLVIWVSIGLGLLAAGAVTKMFRLLLRRWPKPGVLVLLSAAVITIVPAAVVYAEGRDTVGHWQVSTQPVALAELPQPVLVLPTAQVDDYHIMLWSTQGWPVITNGDSGFNSTDQADMRTAAETFPDAASVAALRARGVRTVVLVPSRVGPMSPWTGAQDKPIEGLGITRELLPDAVVYDLRR